MKKSLLALAVTAAAFTGAANAAEIYKTDDASVNFYGQLRTELKWNDVEDKNPELSSGSSRTGIDGSYKVNDNLSVLGLVEVSVDEDSDMYVRQHIFGLSGDFGTIKFGKQFTISDDIYGADYSYFYGGSALRYWTISDAVNDAMVKYVFEADNFWLQADYGLPNNGDNQELGELFVGTSLGDLNLHIGGGYNRSEDILDSAGNNTGVSLKNSYGQATAEYNYGKGVIGFTYYYAKLETENATNISVEENGYSLAATYEWADNATAYAGYELTTHDSDAIELKDSTVVYVGSDYFLTDWARVYLEVAYLDGDTLGYGAGGAEGTAISPSSADDQYNVGLGARFYW
ncbi:porin [Vibrio aphrogenes]|uniref:porin n=1 Tax=Vibrio aphrogenes TaxID=1891186 RepID=UPI000B35E9AC|nr:porin [Vibrio aphrogenes]